MYNESFENFQYDSCISKGICSLNPKISALQTVLVLYLRNFAKYAIEIPYENIDENIKNFILETIAIAIYNTDFSEESFINIVKNFRKSLPEIMQQYFKLYPETDIDKEKSKPLELFRETTDIIKSIRFGEKIFIRGQENLPSNIRDIYNTMLVIANSIAINLLDLKTYNKDSEQGFLSILKLLSKINIEEQSIELLKEEINQAAAIDKELMFLLHKCQEEKFGEQSPSEVSYSTTPGKAVLVVGSNIKELEEVLENLKDFKIDVYTHDDMMLAHTFPKFRQYSGLKGQFGLGLESCLIDFATFPGPIIITKHSLRNIENFYRGRLFTTDNNIPKGVIKIVNNNFDEVIDSAQQSRGFKTGKQCESVNIGYDYKSKIEEIEEKLKTNNYNHIFFIGLDGYSPEQKVYYEKLIKITPKNVLIISFSYNNNQENLIHINACFDSFSILRFFEKFKNDNIGKTVFIPKCERNSLSQMIYFANTPNTNVFVGKCLPIILNPTLMHTLNKLFKITLTTSSKKDIESLDGIK